LRRVGPGLCAGLGSRDQASIAEVARQAWPVVRDRDELHDVLLSLGVVPRATLEASGWTSWAAELVKGRRATWAGALLVAAERVATVRLALGAALPAVRLAPP